MTKGFGTANTERFHIYTSLFARKAAATSEKSTKHTTKTNKQKREKNYAQIGQASEQCYHQQTLKKRLLTSVNIKLDNGVQIYCTPLSTNRVSVNPARLTR